MSVGEDFPPPSLVRSEDDEDDAGNDDDGDDMNEGSNIAADVVDNFAVDSGDEAGGKSESNSSNSCCRPVGSNAPTNDRIALTKLSGTSGNIGNIPIQ